MQWKNIAIKGFSTYHVCGRAGVRVLIQKKLRVIPEIQNREE